MGVKVKKPRGYAMAFCVNAHLLTVGWYVPVAGVCGFLKLEKKARVLVRGFYTVW
jgi:hypothetical protein